MYGLVSFPVFIGPLNFFFLAPYLCSWLQVTCVLLCLKKKSLLLLLQLSPLSYILCLFPYIQTSTFVLAAFNFYLTFSNCWSFHSAFKKMFFKKKKKKENVFHHYLVNIQLALLKKCINKIWFIQFIDSTVLQFLIPDTIS